MELEQLKTELDKIKKENEKLRQENHRLVNENNLLRKNQAKPSNAIMGFSVVKQGKYYAAAKRIKGQLHWIYLGKSKDGAEAKIAVYLERIGHEQSQEEAEPPDDVADLFAGVVEPAPAPAPARKDGVPKSVGECIHQAEKAMADCKMAAERYVEVTKIVLPGVVAG